MPRDVVHSFSRVCTSTSTYTTRTMSRPSVQSSQASFASKTAWEALQIESGEESEEEIIEDPPAAASIE